MIRKCYCQIYCQIGGFEGIAGDKFIFEVSKLLISLMPPPSSNPSLSARGAFDNPVSLRDGLDAAARAVRT